MSFTLDSISVGEAPKPPIILIHGGSGIGKTTLAASFPNPIFIRTEDALNTVAPGTGQLLSSSVPAFPVATDFSQIYSALVELCKNDHGYETVVIDTVDHMAPLVYREVINRFPTTEKGKPVSDIEDYGFGKGYAKALDIWRDVMNALAYLRDEKKMTIIMVAHSEIRRFEDPSEAGYDRFDIAMRAKEAQLLIDLSDCVFFINFKTFIHGEDVGFGNEKKKAKGNGDRILYADPRPFFIAKNRFGMPADLPIRADDIFNSVARFIQYFNERSN